jgi:hypothetical protein
LLIELYIEEDANVHGRLRRLNLAAIDDSVRETISIFQLGLEWDSMGVSRASRSANARSGQMCLPSSSCNSRSLSTAEAIVMKQ